MGFRWLWVRGVIPLVCMRLQCDYLLVRFMPTLCIRQLMKRGSLSVCARERSSDKKCNTFQEVRRLCDKYGACHVSRRALAPSRTAWDMGISGRYDRSHSARRTAEVAANWRQHYFSSFKGAICKMCLSAAYQIRFVLCRSLMASLEASPCAQCHNKATAFCWHRLCNHI